MRLPPVLSFFFIALLSACNIITSDKESTQPKAKLALPLDDIEFKKIRKKQDSLLKLNRKSIRAKDMDTLKPVQT